MDGNVQYYLIDRILDRRVQNGKVFQIRNYMHRNLDLIPICGAGWTSYKMEGVLGQA